MRGGGMFQTGLNVWGAGGSSKVREKKLTVNERAEGLTYR
jgi:hypothetical protein